jgi:hypothetical protein
LIFIACRLVISTVISKNLKNKGKVDLKNVTWDGVTLRKSFLFTFCWQKCDKKKGGLKEFGIRAREAGRRGGGIRH